MHHGDGPALIVASDGYLALLRDKFAVLRRNSHDDIPHRFVDFGFDCRGFSPSEESPGGIEVTYRLRMLHGLDLQQGPALDEGGLKDIEELIFAASSCVRDQRLECNERDFSGVPRKVNPECLGASLSALTRDKGVECGPKVIQITRLLGGVQSLVSLNDFSRREFLFYNFSGP